MVARTHPTFFRSDEVIASLKGMIFVIDSTPTRTVQKRVDELDSQHKCVACEKQCKPGSQAPDGRRRGRCLGEDGCYHKYDLARSKLPEEKRPELDARLQKRGTLIASRQGQRFNQIEPDPVRDELDEIIDQIVGG